MIGTRLSDRFEITGELGRGGMGVVYLARDPVLGRDVAVKMVSLGDAPGINEERFRREARVVAGLDHPAIVPIFDFGRHQEYLYFVMPVVSGTTLHDLIAEDSLNLGETLEIIAQVAEALDYSSRRGVIHRDVKPENIMVSHHGAALRARVMDFGLALRAAGSRITKTGQLPGTLAYLSPEYILSLDIDGRSDLYSLGTILYECLSGEPPFVGPQGSVLFRIVHEDPPPLSVDARLVAIVSRCLAKEPRDRPARGSELAAELRSFRDQLSAAARERTPMSQELRRIQSRRAAAPALIGRRDELAELTRRLDAALDGECQLALLGGEAGIGKTRLLLELELRARARGVRVVRGRFSGQEGTFPHHGFCELIQDFYRSFAPSGEVRIGGSGIRRLDSSAEPSDSRGSYRAKAEGSSSGLPDMKDLAAELLKRFPVLSEIAELRAAAGGRQPTWADGTAPDDQTLVFELLARTLIRLAAGQPVVLLLENLQLAETSIPALEYLVRRLGTTPTLVVASYRSSEIGKRHGVVRLLRNFAGDPRFASLQLEALAAEEHQDLVLSLLECSSGVALRLDKELAERLYEVTEGNPFFTRELVRALLDAGDVGRDDGGSWVLSGEAQVASALPETIQQAVEARLERLPEELVSTLRTASVLGRSFAVDDLIDLAGGGEPLEEAVDQLIREGLLEEERRSRGDVVTFASGVVREVLHGQLTRRRRRSLHRRYAAQLEERHAGRLERVYPQLVYHFSEGDEAVKTVAYALMLARLSAGAISPTDTISATRTALEFVEDEDLDDSGEVEGELRLLLASALRTVGNIAAALKEAARAVRAYQDRDQQGPAAAACLVAAETAWQIRRIDDTRLWLGKGIEVARAAGAGRKLRDLLTLAATVANLRGEHSKARGYLEEAEGLAAQAPRLGAEPTPAGGVLVTALPSPPTTVDPVVSVSVEDAEVLANVFDSLLASDAQGNLGPRLCEDWDASFDGKTFTLTLRPGVRFSDGTELSAREVKRSLEASARRSAGHPVAAFACLRGMADFLEGGAQEVSGIELAGERQIRFHLGEPLPIFPALLTDLRTAMTRETAGGLLGTGPFCLVESDRRRVVLERNPRDWRATPARLDQIELKVCSDPRTIASGLLSGELDLGRDLSPEDLETVLRDPRFRGALVEAPKKNVYFALFNLGGPVARQAEVRRVLARSIRPRDLVWRTLGRFAQPATCFIPPGILGHDAGRRRPVLGRDEGRQELASGGTTAEAPLKLRAAAHPLLTGRYGSLLQALLDDWRELGAEVEVVTSSMSSYLEAWRDCAHLDLLLARWVPDYDDPDNLTFVPFHSREGLLSCYLGDDRLDGLLERARHERNRSRRRVLYRKIESWLADDNVLLPLFHDVDYRIGSPRLRGLRHLSSPPYVNYSELGKEASEAPVAAAVRTGAVVSELRVPLPTAFDDLDPALALFVEPAEVVPNVFETLTRVGEGARIEPCLASGLELEDGGRRLRVALREGVRFHDGRKLTARDVRYSFERLLRSPYAGVETALMPIRGARDFADGNSGELAGLRILSQGELTIELEEPLAFFPAMLANPMAVIVPEGTDAFTGNWREGTAGTGPFRVVGILPGERIELEANPDYWRPGLPGCRRLTFELGVDAQRVATAFAAGELSIAAGLRPEDVEALRREPEYMHRVRESPGFSTYFLAPNSRRGPLADRRLRRALAGALDVETVVKATLGPLGLPAHGLISPGLPGHELRPRHWGLDASSSALLSLDLTTSVHSAFSGQYAHVWRQLCEPLAAAGVTLDVVDRPMPQVLEQIKRGDVDLAAARRIAAYPDSDAFVNIFHSRDGLLGRLTGSDEIDRLIEKGRSETDPTLRHVAYREIEKIFARDALLIPLFDEQICCVARPEVRGLRIRLGWPKVAYEELSLAY